MVCQCGKRREFPFVNDYCRKWVPGLPSHCLLKGGIFARDCPGAKQIGKTDVYFTSDESICNASNCKFAGVSKKDNRAYNSFASIVKFLLSLVYILYLI